MTMKKFLLLLPLLSVSLHAQVPIKASTVDAIQGYTVNGAAPSNQVICGNGTNAVMAAYCGISVANANQVGGVTLAGLCQTSGTGCPASTLARTCNSNGCYIRYPDGTIDAWGTVSVPPSGTGTNTATITFPVAFTTTTNLAVVISTVGVAGSGDAGDPPGAQLSSKSTTGAGVFMARFIQASEGGGHFDNTIELDWHAKGN